MSQRLERKLCVDCKAIDFSKLVEKIRHQYEDFYGSTHRVLVSLANQDLDTAASSSCELCRAFHTIRMPKGTIKSLSKADKRSTLDYVLVGGMYELGGWDHPCFMVVPDVCRCLIKSRRCDHHQEPIQAHMRKNNLLAYCDYHQDRSYLDETWETLDLVVPSRVKTELLMDWLGNCIQNHPQCRAKSLESNSHLGPAFIIDCEEKTVIPTPANSRYSALSYVWGTSNLGSQDTIGSAPRVIRDAMSLTLSLGLRYLWVDRICIPNDASAKHNEIANMNIIYEGAEVTFIDAVGSNAEHGLHGLGPSTDAQRLDQIQTVSADGVPLVSCLYDPWSSMPETWWSSRAWTLQEGVLSRRRLFFMEDQVYFECSMGRRIELLGSAEMNLKSMLLTDLYTDMRVVERRGENVEKISDETLRGSMKVLREHIEEYSMRNMTYDSDALNAMLGILNSFSAEGLSHHWGIPFPTDRNINPFAESLLWFHEGPVSEIKRRSSMPSWSYVGYHGPVTIADADRIYEDGIFENRSKYLQDGMANIFVETVTGEKMPLMDNKITSLPETIVSPIVTFTAKTIKPSLEVLEPTPSSRKDTAVLFFGDKIVRMFHDPATVTAKKRKKAKRTPEVWLSVDLGPATKCVEDFEAGNLQCICVYPLFWFIIRHHGTVAERVGLIQAHGTLAGQDLGWQEIRLR